jgi:hypothetical protein
MELRLLSPSLNQSVADIEALPKGIVGGRNRTVPFKYEKGVARVVLISSGIDCAIAGCVLSSTHGGSRK